MADALRVAYWNNTPAPYMVDRFNAVADRGVLDFEAWFTETTVPHRTWEVRPETWRFAHRFARVARVGGALVGLPPRVPSDSVPDVVVSLYAEAPYLTRLAWPRLRRAKTALWVEVTFDSWVHRTRVKEAAKRVAFSHADGILTAGEDGRRYAVRYGASGDRIHVVPHVIDAARFRAAAGRAAARRDDLRRRLGLRGLTFLYVGRLWSGKGMDDLLTAFALAQTAAARDLSLLLVGQGADEGPMRHRIAREGIDGVVFAGFHQQDELGAFYAASDVFVFPTLGDPYGLVVDEAMACSLPVVSSDAAGEIAPRIVDGHNGYVVKAGDPRELAARMVGLAEDAGLRRRMGRAAWEVVSWQSPERWARDFEQAVLAVAGA